MAPLRHTLLPVRSTRARLFSIQDAHPKRFCPYYIDLHDRDPPRLSPQLFSYFACVLPAPPGCFPIDRIIGTPGARPSSEYLASRSRQCSFPRSRLPLFCAAICVLAVPAILVGCSFGARSRFCGSYVTAACFRRGVCFPRHGPFDRYACQFFVRSGFCAVVDPIPLAYRQSPFLFGGCVAAFGRRFQPFFRNDQQEAQFFGRCPPTSCVTPNPALILFVGERFFSFFQWKRDTQGISRILVPPLPSLDRKQGVEGSPSVIG